MANVTMSLEDFAQLIRERDEDKMKIKQLEKNDEFPKYWDGKYIVEGTLVFDFFDDAQKFVNEYKKEALRTYRIINPKGE